MIKKEHVLECLSRERSRIVCPKFMPVSALLQIPPSVRKAHAAADDDCETAVDGDECYSATRLLMSKDFFENMQDYPSLKVGFGEEQLPPGGSSWEMAGKVAGGPGRVGASTTSRLAGTPACIGRQSA